LVAHHGDATFGGGGGGCQLASLVNVMGQWLLAIDVFAGLERGHGDGGMGVVGRGDEHRLDVVLLGEHLAKILPALGGGKSGKRRRGKGMVHIAEGDDVFSGQIIQVAAAHAANADAGDAQLAGGGRRLGKQGWTG